MLLLRETTPSLHSKRVPWANQARRADLQADLQTGRLRLATVRES